MRLLLLAMWVGWLVYWAIAARGTKATQWHEPVSGLWLHNLLALLGTVVMAVPRAAPAILAQPFLPPSPIGTWLGVTLTALGLGIAVAARIYLGSNWSARVEIKEDHSLIRTRPLSLCPAPDLFGDSPRPARQRDRARPLAGAFGLCPDLRGTLAQSPSRGRTVAPGPSGLRRLCTGNGSPDPLPALKSRTHLPIDSVRSKTPETIKTRQPQYLVKSRLLRTKCCCVCWQRGTGF